VDSGVGELENLGRSASPNPAQSEKGRPKMKSTKHRARRKARFCYGTALDFDWSLFLDFWGI
jgi:hypothetical protein